MPLRACTMFADQHVDEAGEPVDGGVPSVPLPKLTATQCLLSGMQSLGPISDGQFPLHQTFANLKSLCKVICKALVTSSVKGLCSKEHLASGVVSHLKELKASAAEKSPCKRAEWVLQTAKTLLIRKC